ncbi:43313_t:CDS:2 [Gigaspora margarita]|uniref:43313_t:CDS:1 n=1 Tax=Gigaspora margarita TaxID=4874 RepID=A0ABM8W0D6_GIGMA|nr:43313_t:CDS:2 [Gigaspora margarita]
MAHKASELIQKKIEEQQKEFYVVLIEDFNHIVNLAVDKQPKNLKDMVEKAEIEEIETITGSDHSLVLLQLRTDSIFSQIKECSFEKNQTTRLIWNLDMATKEN